MLHEEKVIGIEHKAILIGAAHIDRKAQAMEEIQLRTSIPIAMSVSFGGVARNIAENLSRLGVKTTILTAIGNDQDGENLQKHFNEVNIESDHIYVHKSHNTASYTAILDTSGELVLGLADMDIYTALDPSYFMERDSVLMEHSVWVIDTNITTESLYYIVSLKKQNPNITLLIDPVSVPKSEKLRGILDGIDFLFPNREEAEQLSGVTITSSADVVKAGQALLQQGVKNVIITLGNEGVMLVNNMKVQHFSPFHVQVVDVTGAGDSLVAGFIYGLSKGYRVTEAIQYGLATAALTLTTKETVHPNMSAKQIHSIMVNERE